jgi:hypothetical protein
VLDEAGRARTVELRDRAAAVVPRGVWHTGASADVGAARKAVPGGHGHGLEDQDPLR